MERGRARVEEGVDGGEVGQGTAVGEVCLMGTMGELLDRGSSFRFHVVTIVLSLASFRPACESLVALQVCVSCSGACDGCFRVQTLFDAWVNFASCTRCKTTPN